MGESGARKGEAMKCVVCGGRTVVTSTYQNADGLTKRRRECGVCNYRFTTREKPEKNGVELAVGWRNRSQLERAERRSKRDRGED